MVRHAHHERNRSARPEPALSEAEGPVEGRAHDMKKLIAIVGATATGKTALAVALAQRFDGEIINADSRQVYRYMDIGTAKATVEERAQVPYHLIDVVDPDEPFSLGRYLELAQAALADIWGRGKQPLLVGGTGQYVWALLEGWRVPRVPPQPDLRRRLEERAAREGKGALYQELGRIDPEAAAGIDPRNLRRVIRALEVYEVTGKPLSYWRQKAAPEHPTLIIGLWLPRDELYRRIDERIDGMVRRGLVEEVEGLLAKGYSRELPAMSGIGYKEVCQYLAGEIDPSTSLRAEALKAEGSGQALATAVQRVKTETHRLSRHQNNWFKGGDPRIRWIRAGEGAVEEAVRIVESELGLWRTVAHGR